MSNVAKLKKQAAELELKKQFDKALAVYVKLLESFDQHPGEIDVALFNRVGDLMLRQGNVADAVDYYEQAVDHYADTGFFNNAIALCNKILRHSPGRASVYYKLGKISAQKGFKNDAKVNFLEYADRMQKAGKVDESFRALKEFADLCPDQDEIRLMLADQLTRADRKAEAIEQLQTLHERYESEGRRDEASATAGRMRDIDPTVAPRSGGGGRKSKSQDLVFLDLDTPAPRHSDNVPAVLAGSSPPPASRPPAARRTPASPKTPAKSRTPARSRTPAKPPTPTSALTPPDGAPLDDVTRIGDDTLDLQKTPSESLLGLESTRLADDDLLRSTPSNSLLDIEPTSIGSMGSTPVHRSSAPTHAAQDENGEANPGADLELDLPSAEPTPIASSPSIDFDLSVLTTPTSPSHQRPSDRGARPSNPTLYDLPLLDLEVPEDVAPATVRPTPSLAELTATGEFELIEEGTGDDLDVGLGNPAGEPLIWQTVNDASQLIDLNAESLTIDDDGDGDSDDDEVSDDIAESVVRKATQVAVESMEHLRSSVEADPENWPLHRELAEAMLDAGERQAGIRELEVAMAGADRTGNLDLASALAEEVARLEPEQMRHHQKRVEYAFRINDRGRLIEAYLSLADALLRSDQTDKAKTVYQRVLDLAPDELRAREALEALEALTAQPSEAPPEPVVPEAGPRRDVRSSPSGRTNPASREAAGPDAFVNLGDMLRDGEAPRDTRMVVAEQEPSGDEEADFADMLRKFKQGVAENVDPEDYQSHYDLGVAFKEMGLLDEAIAQFQKALGSRANRVPTYEALGQCFVDKEQYKLASSILSRALTEQAGEDQLVGVLYLLGLSAEAQGNAEEALAYYQRVFVVDIQFRDIAVRMNEVEHRGATQ